MDFLECVRVLLTLALLLGAARPGVGGERTPGTSTALGQGQSAAAVIGVDALVKHADRHEAAVSVRGVVSRTFADRQTLVLIDEEEYRRCGLASCGAQLLCGLE